tara:strand:+ start:290 stop:832 length:543 start_codon:yes stop_codon:yes gene_type:complete
MSTLNVDNINEYTSGNGVEIPGHIVQVVSTDDHTVASYSLSGTSPQKLGSLEISITPKSSSSKIYLSSTINGQCKGRYMAVCFVRGTNTKLGESTNTAGSRSLVFMSPVYGEYNDVEYSALPTSMQYVDSPSTTSATTYYVAMYRPYGTDTFYYNSPENTTDAAWSYRTRSVFTAMEIAQ